MQVEWFQCYLPKLEKEWKFEIDPKNTSRDGYCTSFESAAVHPTLVKAYFKHEGFINLDGREYMRHTGNPHINLTKEDNTVQISWFPRGGKVGITFLKGLKNGA